MSPAAIVRPSPNQARRPPGVAIDTLVLHYTGMSGAAAAIERLSDPAAKVSSHYVVDEDGTVTQLVEEHRRAAHAGVSFWRGREDLNDSSIGIEIVNPGHEWGYRDFPPSQLAVVIELCREIAARHPIDPRRVVGHSDIAPDRKQDPGERFPWSRLASRGVGLWPAGMPRSVDDATPLDPAEQARLRSALGAIGYRTEPGSESRTGLPIVAAAFQRRWRPARCDGALDRGTLVAAEIVADLHRS